MQKGIMKTLLSSFFVKFRDVSDVFNRMLDRIDNFYNIIGILYYDVSDNKSLKNV